MKADLILPTACSAELGGASLVIHRYRCTQKPPRSSRFDRLRQSDPSLKLLGFGIRLGSGLPEKSSKIFFLLKTRAASSKSTVRELKENARPVTYICVL
jgi:hypothetical protein